MMRRLLLLFMLFLLSLYGCEDDVNKAVIDLTKMSETMVYAEVYNMVTEPQSYLGKLIKVSGSYYPSYYEPTDKIYHFILIEDALACCQQGLEFICDEHNVYLDDLPERDTHIEVIGTYDSYEEDGKTYYHLVASDLVY